LEAVRLMSVDSVKAAELLSEAWDLALRRSWHLGYETGRREGWLAGRDEERDAWNRIIGVYRETVSRPTFAELQERRGES
jgi:hypothetical protein